MDRGVRTKNYKKIIRNQNPVPVSPEMDCYFKIPAPAKLETECFFDIPVPNNQFKAET